MSIPQFLRDKLREGHVVPFVGAGVSINVLDRLSRKPVFPSWRKLLLDAADRLEAETKTAEAKLVRSLLDVQDFLDAANRARNALGPVWYSFLKDALEVEFSRIDPESLDLARRIWRLGSNLLITTTMMTCCDGLVLIRAMCRVGISKLQSNKRFCFNRSYADP